MKGIYLDNSMTSRPSDRAVGSMMPYLTQKWGSPSQPHACGNEVLPGIEGGLRAIYALLGADENDGFVFTSSGAEAVNQALLSAYFDITMATGHNHFLIGQTDEAPAIMSLGRLEQLSCNGKLVQPSSGGYIEARTIGDEMTPRTAIVSLSWASGLTGVVNPVKEIGKVCRERGVRLHLDATHALGKLFYHLEDIDVDLISFNGDQLHAPKGTGGLWIRGGKRCSPFIYGGIEQAGMRAGAYSVAGLVALGEAAKEAYEARDLMGTEVARLRDKLEDLVTAGFAEAVVFFRDQERLPHVTAIGFPGIANEAMLFALNQQRVYACIGGGSFQQIGIVLHASGIDEALAHTAVSFSLSRETSEEEIEQAAAIIIETARKLRSLSMRVS